MTDWSRVLTETRWRVSRDLRSRAVVMVALGLGASSLLLAMEGMVLRGRVDKGPADRRALGYRSLSLLATTVPLVLLGALFLAFATCRLACG